MGRVDVMVFRVEGLAGSLPCSFHLRTRVLFFLSYLLVILADDMATSAVLVLVVVAALRCWFTGASGSQAPNYTKPINPKAPEQPLVAAGGGEELGQGRGQRLSSIPAIWSSGFEVFRLPGLRPSFC